ncbi:hypothetical protein LTR91_005753 [Friedmanniomyces endolithicus]|uniref:Uncharacterized protein n=1 Tax=Friedmanniomyces endolithicus TaxID=329885 RepID=A0AAN6KT02_9PEZI|nr:hypothetical protein LTR01_005277 [Friedmanniomyces endolithicus]KAK0831700.1 hypothetical protein LTR73_003083 [Friedmanniomyces endolithicus]KAK0921335.1 hypothetical protein LTR57_008791 [Friedmanniomyces endolithicus]KAK1000309.1 hypothetical protein LTR91_005753 [Friedmanniomyces endolithicus]KAK1000401.1 hypothetical protein LTS01_004963 [Friedmanniomyces endolithicus]
MEQQQQQQYRHHTPPPAVMWLGGGDATSTPPPPPPTWHHNQPQHSEGDEGWQPPSRRASLIASLARQDSAVDPPASVRQRSSRTPSVPSLTHGSSCGWEWESEQVQTPQYAAPAAPLSRTYGESSRPSSRASFEACPLPYEYGGPAAAAAMLRNWVPERPVMPRWPVIAPRPINQTLVRHDSGGAGSLPDPQHSYELPAVPQAEAPSITCSTAGIDLNSASAHTQEISFVDPSLHRSPILVLRVPNALRTCEIIKKWLYLCCAERLVSGNIRMEAQDLHLLDRTKAAHLVLLENAAHLDNDPRQPLAILALLVKSDPKIRWFYTPQHPGKLLRFLTSEACLANSGISLHPHSTKHTALYIFLRQAFTAALEILQHPDFLLAETLTDYSPSIASPSTALTRLTETLSALTHSAIHLTPSTPPPQDRYSPVLPLPEHHLAAAISLPSSAYLLLKRRFFAAFWQDLLANRERIGDGRRKVRSETAHEAWLMGYEGLVFGKGAKGGKEGKGRRLMGKEARRLVVGWRVLGFLREERYLGWLGGGGMLEDAGAEEAGDEKA